MIKAESEKDILINKIIKFVKGGWPNSCVDPEIKQYFIRRNELSIENDILLCGYRVVIPSKLRSKVLNELHISHLGIVKMKSKARSYFWWPSIDKDIEILSKNCEQCIQNRPEQPKVNIKPWPTTEYPYQRVHIDILGPIENKMFLIILDSFSKWVEAFQLQNLTSKTVIEKIRECIARFGLIETLVSDNGGQFKSFDFENFCLKNGIKHLTSAPYHPQSNGAAENAVKSFKNGIYKALSDPKNINISFATIVNRYLFNYRSSIHATTAETPFKKMFGRDMKIHFDRMIPRQTITSDSQLNCTNKSKSNKRNRNFEIGDNVRIRKFSNKKKSWQKAVVDRKIGNKMYGCRTSDGDCRRHANQMMMGNAVNFNSSIERDFSSTTNRSTNQEIEIAEEDDPIDIVNISSEESFQSTDSNVEVVEEAVAEDPVEIKYSKFGREIKPVIRFESK